MFCFRSEGQRSRGILTSLPLPVHRPLAFKESAAPGFLRQAVGRRRLGRGEEGEREKKEEEGEEEEKGREKEKKEVEERGRRRGRRRGG